MITGQKNTEKAYRNSLLDSYSSLKDFSMDRKKYYRKYIMNERIEDEENKSMMIGNLVECLLFERHLFDSKFKMSEVEKTSTGKMLSFVNALVKYTLDSTDEEGVVTKDFEQISRLAYAESGFEWKYELVMSKFWDSKDEQYFNELMEVTYNNLTVVGIQDVTNAERIVDELKNNSITAFIVNMVNTERYEVLTQLQVDGFEIDGYKLKSMLDKVYIDHEEKTINPFDLKCTWSVENFYEDGYLYRRYYLQAYIYNAALQHYVNSREDLKGYKINPMSFISCDSINYYSPLIYQTNSKHLSNAYFGFSDEKGRKYPGVKEIIQDLKFAHEFNVWNISRKNYQNKGIVVLPNG